ncbi:glycosyltransferase family 4 protein [Halorubrum ejinorense]|uniref:Glycosyltransferase family 4 protein n=1 Tax=Halorubrum ejinorense TaxID=425309 RepID=A0AAV3SY21_9EURY
MYPPKNGAEVRLWKTAQKLSTLGDLWVAAPPGEQRLDGDMEPIDVTSPLFNHQPVWDELWTGLFAVSARHPLRQPLANAMVEPVERTTVSFDVVVCEFPQVTDAAAELSTSHDAKLLLNKHNADYEILDGYLRERSVPSVVRRRLVENFREFEANAIETADVTVFQSEEDRKRFDVGAATDTFVIPNGCDYRSISHGGDPEAAARECGIPGDGFTCVFLGSYDYAPNRRAARLIIDDLAPALPDVDFLLLGRNPPAASGDNVYAPGYVADLAGALHLADAALCPLTTGSGTKLKMLDYFAAELPVISTTVGTQGLSVEPGREALVCDDAEGFVGGIERLRSSPELRRRLGESGREIAAEHSWDSLMAEYDAVIEALRD